MRLTPNAVEAEDVVLGYEGRVVFSRSSFTMPAGAITALIGPNGSGKSTLLNAVAGLLTPMSGRLGRLGPDGAEPRVSYVLQTTKVNQSLPISVREVVTMGRYAVLGPYRRLGDEDRDAVEEAMRRTGVLALAGRQLHELSGGQRQRVFVAQGLAQAHDILLLDEPLTGVDLTSAQAIDKVIHEEKNEGCAVIMATHDLSEALVADHVLLLSGGVVASGPPGLVLHPENLAAAYGSAILHVEEGRVFVDDHAHIPIPGWHVHRDRSIHIESAPRDRHPE